MPNAQTKSYVGFLKWQTGLHDHWNAFKLDIKAISYVWLRSPVEEKKKSTKQTYDYIQMEVTGFNDSTGISTGMSAWQKQTN